MKTLDRMILKQVTAPFFGALATFTVIMLLDRMFDLMDMIIRKGVPIGNVLQVVAYTLPFILSFTAPMAVLVAVLVAYGRMAQDYEILAAKALGVSTLRLSLGPVIGTGLLGVFLFWFNNQVIPESNHRLKNLLMEIGRKRPTAQIARGIFTRIEDYLVYVGDKDDRSSAIYDVKIQSLKSGQARTIVAEKGHLFVLGDTVMVFALENGEVHQTLDSRQRSYRRVLFHTYTMKIPLNPELIQQERKYRSDKEKLFSQLWKDIKTKQKDLSTAKLDPGARKAMRTRMYQMWVELHRRFALPVAGIIFVLVGVPLAVMTKRGGYGTAFGVSFFVFVLYYIFLMGGEQLSQRGVLPHPVVWVPNLIFIAIAGFLIYKEGHR